MTVSGAPTAVIGASGFLGSALLAGLVADGAQALGFTRQTPYLGAEGAPGTGLLESATVYWAASSINPWIAENHPERIAHDRGQLIAMLDALDASPDAVVVLLSSGGAVYDPAGVVPHREDAACRPAGAYGRAKLELERILLDRRPNSVIVRVANAYGPGQPMAPGQGVIGHWLRALRDGNPIELIGSPETARDYVYIDDITAALVTIRKARDVPQIINIGSGRTTTLGWLLERIAEMNGPFTVVKHAPRTFDVDTTWLDIALAERSLGWTPTTQLDEGLRRTWRWLLADPAR